MTGLPRRWWHIARAGRASGPRLGAGFALVFVVTVAFSVVQAQETPARVAAWSRTAQIDQTAGPLEERGAAVFNNWCDACHRNSDQNAPGTRSLELKYRGEIPAALEERTDLTAELVEFYVRNGIATMPFYRKTEISDTDLEALAAFLAP